MSLDYRDVEQILALLDDTAYEELSLTLGEVTLHLKRTADGWQQNLRAATPATETASLALAPAAAEPAPTEDGLVELRAPMAGTFYRSPKPGAAPYTEIGQAVAADTVVGIVEVMKLMNAIPAGQQGEVVEILVDDACFIDKGTLLMRIRPEAG